MKVSSSSSSPPFEKPKKEWHPGLDFLLAYMTFGFLHEISHIVTARCVGYGSVSSSKNISTWIGIFLGRGCIIPGMESSSQWEVDLVHHVGWMTSVLLAVMVYVINRKLILPKKNEKTCSMDCITLAAFVTALEAICTDLLGFGSFNSDSTTTFLCGNFGIILLNDSWTKTPGDYGKTALNLLQKMIQVTMMRGAQTGGVVTWIGGDSSKFQAPTSVRSRVVNGKRTDLSEEVRRLLNKEVVSGGKLNSSIQFLMGHTRFATSSKATMGGTHPHQWSPPSKHRIFPLEDFKTWNSNEPEPTIQEVSNFITHNGDLDFFVVNGHHADLELVQFWLVQSTGHPLPTPVDSVAIAGLVDIIRCAGCFALSLRYSFLIASNKSHVTEDREYPTFQEYEKLGLLFEHGLLEFLKKHQGNTLTTISNSTKLRIALSKSIYKTWKTEYDIVNTPFGEYADLNGDEVDVEHLKEVEEPKEDTVDDDVDHLSHVALYDLVAKTIDAFFDNDLMETTKIFLAGAVGSFGVVFTSSMDARRQICIAARGQPMSIAFYPDKGVICYGSELAAVKAGMTFDCPGGNNKSKYGSVSSSKFLMDMTQETCRFDLDDLGGEVALIDFSKPGDATIKTYQESKTAGTVRSRITPLKGNEFLLPLTPDYDDPILSDIQSIPVMLQNIQTKWKDGGLNRMAAWYLGKKLSQRLQGRVVGKYGNSLDILVTGCEVSLWLAEQFVSDLQKSFPGLRVKSTSSNKLLGVLGQELAVPCVGHPVSGNIPDLKNSIVIIVSHSGGTFGPLAISNLLQSVTRDIFVVSSEWDTQIGKQLRGMSKSSENSTDFLASRVFTTDIGVRPAEPCSLSVVATHQLLTQIFEYICLIVLRDHAVRDLASAVITYQDLQILERCNLDAIHSLERLVGVDLYGNTEETAVHEELKAAGDLWADHVLENARAYIMSIIYIVVTVTIGWPMVTGIAAACGLNTEWAFYITRFIDSLIYVGLPQINIIILRLIQGRELLHRMTGRTAVIGDVPWVAQSAEAFLSKIFARSYSIAGLNVLSGNPTDHLVHRHTHRVTRGSLLVCGRPDGRLAALTSAECAVNLSVNQASSIQSMGGTCESITIGHNPSKLGLTKMDIALSTSRPKFLCEQLLDSMDEDTRRKQHALEAKLLIGTKGVEKSQGLLRDLFNIFLGQFSKTADDDTATDSEKLNRSSHSLKGAYLGMKSQSARQSIVNSKRNFEADNLVGTEMKTEEFQIIERESKSNMILEDLLSKSKQSKDVKEIFNNIDADGSGTIDLEEFLEAYTQLNANMSREEGEAIFREGKIPVGC